MFTFLFVMTWACALFAIGGIIADYILPRIKWFNDFMKTLPIFWDE